jgi:hypothetical protein
VARAFSVLKSLQDQIAAKASLKTKLAAITDIEPAKQNDRNRFVDCALPDAGVAPVPFIRFAVCVAKLKPMIH